MKKSLLIFFTLVLVLSVAFSGCNKSNPPGNDGGSNEGGGENNSGQEGNEGGTVDGGNEENSDGGSDDGTPGEGGNEEGTDDGSDDSSDDGTPDGGSDSGGNDNTSGSDQENNNPTDPPSGGNSGSDTPEAPSDSEEPVDRGKMTVSGPESIYTNYPAKDITVTFTEDDYTSLIEYTTSDSRVFVENGKIYAKGRFSSELNVTVTATTPYHEDSFTVKVSEFNINNDEPTLLDYENNIIKPENKGGTIFIGDSYFSGQLKNGKPSFWSDFYEDYTDGKTFLMGISSSQIVNWEIVAERIVYPMEPSEIVVHIGFNDIHSSERSPEEIASRIIALLDEFARRIPGVKIYYCSVEPKKNALDSGSAYYEKSMVGAPKINSLLEAYANENANVTFVNTRALFFNSDGSINKGMYLSTDLSHPTLAAYDKYRHAIEVARGNDYDLPKEPTPSEVIAGVKANQSAVSDSAAAAKGSSTVYSINDSTDIGKINVIAKYFTDKNGGALKNYYSVKGYMEISNLQTGGAHVQFRFSDTTADRFLLYDSNSNKKLGICAPFLGKSSESVSGSVADAIDVSGGSAVISWQVIVTGNTAYLYINNVLVFYGTPGAFSYFNVSAEKADISFFGVEVTVKAENQDAYDAIIKQKKVK